jgi:dipeptidyl aminopeptidase/acylaminoacyl peptidase
LLTIAKQGGKQNKLDLDSIDGPVAKFLDGLPKDKPDLAKRASPITFVRADNPPILIMHGDADDVVPIQQSEEFYRALKAANVRADFFIVKGGAHNFVTLDNLARVKEFFDREIR